MAYPQGAIPILRKGQRITAEHYAAVTEAAQDKFCAYPHDGISDYTGATNLIKIVPPNRIQVVSTTDLPLRSVFQLVKSGSGPECSRDVTVFNANVADNSTYNKIWVVNDTDEILANTPSWVTVIAPDKPIKVLADAANPPTVLQPCGVGTGQSTVNVSHSGLICLSTINEDNFVDVVVAPPQPSPRIHFAINSINYGARYAICSILEITCGATAPDLNYDGSVTIYDTAGCWFNPPTVPSYQDCNIGRQGWAERMQPYGYSGNGICRWVVSSMCPFGCVLVLKDFTCNADGTITKVQTPVTGCC